MAKATVEASTKTCGYRDRRWSDQQPGGEFTEEMAPSWILRDELGFQVQSFPTPHRLFFPVHSSNSCGPCQRPPNLALWEIHQDVSKNTASRAYQNFCSLRSKEKNVSIPQGILWTSQIWESLTPFNSIHSTY